MPSAAGWGERALTEWSITFVMFETCVLSLFHILEAGLFAVLQASKQPLQLLNARFFIPSPLFRLLAFYFSENLLLIVNHLPWHH